MQKSLAELEAAAKAADQAIWFIDCAHDGNSRAYREQRAMAVEQAAQAWAEFRAAQAQEAAR